MPTDPLTASRYPASSAAPNVPQDIQNAVSDLSINTCPRFASTTARDSAYTAYTNAGGTLANGRSCWTDDAGYWDRIGGVWVARVARSDVFGTSGNLSLLAGWAVFSAYHTPAWYLSAQGLVTLSGAVVRTGADVALGTGTQLQFANIPPAIQPVVTSSPGGAYVGVNAPVVSYPARIWASNTSNFLSVIGMDSGTGTIKQNSGGVFFDGVSWHL